MQTTQDYSDQDKVLHLLSAFDVDGDGLLKLDEFNQFWSATGGEVMAAGCEMFPAWANGARLLASLTSEWRPQPYHLRPRGP